MNGCETGGSILRDLSGLDPFDDTLSPLQIGAHIADAVVEGQHPEEMFPRRGDFLLVWPELFRYMVILGKDGPQDCSETLKLVQNLFVRKLPGEKDLDQR